MTKALFVFFSPGGVLMESFVNAEGGEELLPARLYLANVRDPDDGVLAEAGRLLPPGRRVPWIDRAARDRALDSLSAERLSDTELTLVTSHIATTPYYAGEAIP